jgi:transcriptional regulator with XRE-family HTH domain
MKIKTSYKTPLEVLLRQRREQLGMTQEQVGNLVGVTSMQISNFENGWRIPRLNTLDAWARALKMELIVGVEANEQANERQITIDSPSQNGEASTT